MPLVTDSSHTPPFYLFNGHLQTIIPSLFRRVKGVEYQRERIATPDQDFLDVDWSSAPNPLPEAGKRLAILSHGLEGDSRRSYILGMVRALNAHGWDALAWNYRGCSGEPNCQPRFYHSGATDDLEVVVNHALARTTYTKVALIGFSLGGNLTLKYLGEQGSALPSVIQRAVAFSVPLDLLACSVQLGTRANTLYKRRFLASLRRKVQSKTHGSISSQGALQARTLQEFDEAYTAPLHGFLHAHDYYERCSAKNFLASIAIPTLIVNAQNDPFLAPACFPIELVKDLPQVFLEIPQKGGHCGFFSKTLHGTYWSEERALTFINA